MRLEKYSIGVGDRFTRQAKSQLSAMIAAKNDGIDVVPVWNKSHREHSTIKTEPQSTRDAADAAVKALGWKGSYYCDADHIGLNNVELFVNSCDFFTLDVADFIGQKAQDAQIKAFVNNHIDLADKLNIRGITAEIEVSVAMIEQIAGKVLLAVKEAAKIYKKIAEVKGEGNFVTEVSMDETDIPQSPVELLFILAALSDEGIPAQTIAPRFSGRFNKGVDYVGDVGVFEREFEYDVAVIDYAVSRFNLPQNLKLSVHSGSDKFSIYPAINRVLKKYDCGLHLKTAGTTWLEEVIGLAVAGGEALDMAKLIYRTAYGRFDELCKPYASVIDIDKSRLPSPEEVDIYSGEVFAASLRHEQSCKQYNPDLRQLIHVGYKVAAEMGSEYLDIIDKNADIIAKGASENILERHIKRIFY